MIRVGLTGNMGSGKTTVARCFEELGAVVVDADAIVHELLAPGGGAEAEVVAAFPEAADAAGRIERGRLAGIVFADAGRRRVLEALLHPRVARRTAELAEEAGRAGADMFVADATLLFEAWEAGTAPHPRDRFDAIVVVTCDDATRRLRLADRARARGAAPDPEDVERRMAAQMPQEEKARRADHVIDNGGSLEDTRRQVAVVHSRLLEAARSK